MALRVLASLSAASPGSVSAAAVVVTRPTLLGASVRTCP